MENIELTDTQVSITATCCRGEKTYYLLRGQRVRLRIGSEYVFDHTLDSDCKLDVSLLFQHMMTEGS